MKKSIAILFVLLLIAGAAYARMTVVGIAGMVAVAASTVTHDGEDDVTFSGRQQEVNITLADKTTAGTNRAGVVQLSLWREYGGAGITVTWGGEAPDYSYVTDWEYNPEHPAEPYTTIGIYIFLDPPTSASNIVVGTNTESWAWTEGAVSASSFSGVNQTTPVRSNTVENGGPSNTGFSNSVTSSADDFVVDTYFGLSTNASGILTEGANQTVVASHDYETTASSMALTRKSGAATSQTMSYTNPPTHITWWHRIVSLQP